ncbi:10676_t:CDS:2 [Paraglomus occultum]|uniref:Non-structural maintenance of chromosomes element 4 n=1 Tax=Paraglomus occultum TaxID=144539 RepID=A0A9N9EZR3_9GLOM|nr:10676_t:CDS:2 [Paraglomus occultum]
MPAHTRATNDANKENAMDVDVPSEVGEQTVLTMKTEDGLEHEDYDPNQDKEEKRWLRKAYRSLILQTEENRQEYLRPESDGLKRTLNKANELYQKVKQTHEATLDSRLLVLSGDLGVQKARLMRVDSNAFDIDDYVAKLVTFMGGRQYDDEDESPKLDWKALGKVAARYTDRVPTMDFMLGPLSVEQKQRKTPGQRARLVKCKDDLKRPQEIKEGDLIREENETTRNVVMIYKILEENTPINMFEFILNPESYGQSVENLFYVAFLIRDGKAYIEDETGEPILSICEPPTQEDYQQGLTKKQLVMELDYHTWKDTIECYGIKRPIIATRQKKAVKSSYPTSVDEVLGGIARNKTSATAPGVELDLESHGDPWYNRALVACWGPRLRPGNRW